jgi:hypothetical protein
MRIPKQILPLVFTSLCMTSFPCAVCIKDIGCRTIVSGSILIGTCIAIGGSIGGTVLCDKTQNQCVDNACLAWQLGLQQAKLLHVEV